MKKTSKKTKTILLSSLTTLALVSGTAAIVLSNSSNASKKSNVTIANKNSKVISNNASSKNNLKNPDQLIFMSQVLNSQNAPIFENGSVNQENLNKWINFKENIKNLEGYEGNQVAKDLASMIDKVEKVKELNESIQKIKDLATSDPLIAAVQETIIQNLKDQAGVSENMSDIEGIDDIPSKLLELSGIVEGTKIQAITNYDRFFETDLIKSSSSATSNLSIGNVAGEGYKQLIKIAEIDPSQQGNYALKFGKYNGAQTTSGTLYIKNDKGQLSSYGAQQLANNLDIFGRWNTSNNNSIVGSTLGYDEMVNTFIFQKNTQTNKFEILVRLKENESLNNLEFSTNIEGATNLQTPSKFGILDVQASDSQTFRDKIMSESSGKLTNISDSTNVVTSINFFSDTMVAIKDPSAQGWKNNRSLTFYQGSDVEFNLPLYSCTSIVSGSANYSQIDIYQNGISTGDVQNITLTTNGSVASTLQPEVYQMYTDLKAKLPEELRGDDFVEASTITLKSGVDANSTFTKQTLTYSDNFYGIGKRGWSSVSLSAERIGGIGITDPTQKIFFEKPKNFTEPTSFTESTTKAAEQVNEREKMLSIMEDIYKEFSKSNSGIFNDLKFNLDTVSAYQTTTNIRLTDLNLNNKSGNDLYTILNNNWKLVAGLIATLFKETGVDVNRYNVSQPNVVKNWLAKASEFSSSNVESIINDAIVITKADENAGNQIGNDLTLNSLTKQTKDKLANKVALLIKEQFTAINNEFKSKIYNPVYNKLKEIFESTSNQNISMVKSVDSLVEVFKSQDGISLIKYKDGAWNEIVSTTSTTVKSSFKSLLDLMYFENGNGIALGNSIFETNEMRQKFASFDSTSLTTFESDSVSSKQDKIAIYGKLISFLTNGNSDYDLEAMVNDMLVSGKPIDESKLNKIESALITSVNNVGGIRKDETLQSEPVTSYYLDDIISGTNAIICMTWKLDQIMNSSGSSVKLTSSRVAANREGYESELVNKIESILGTNQQVSASELGIWSSIVDNGNYNYSNYTTNLSGRGGVENINSVSNKLIQDSSILAKRVLPEMENQLYTVMEDLLKNLWWVLVACVGVGVFVSSAVGIATKSRQIKLSSRPVIKWLLVSGIILGIAVATVAILLGIGII